MVRAMPAIISASWRRRSASSYRRAFSRAMAAWSVKASTSACSSAEQVASLRESQGQDADDPSAAPKRRGERGHDARVRPALPPILGHLDVRVVQDVPRPEETPFLHRPAGEAEARREHHRRKQLGGPRARRRDGQGAVGVQLAHGGEATGEEVERARDDLGADRGHVAHARQHPCGAGEALGLLPPALPLLEEARVLQRHRGLVGEGLDEGALVVGERAGLAGGEPEHADDPAAVSKRHRECGAVPALPDHPAPLLVETQAGVGEEVGRPAEALLT